MAAILPALGGGPAPTCSRGGPRDLPHDVAFVSDSRSHGQVGDSWLSLNEVIQLHNRTLQVAQLSLSEQGQLGGSGLDISWGEIDSANVPTITVERDLDVILDLPHGLLLRGGGRPPVIDFTAGNIAHGFRCLSNSCSWQNLLLLGGPYGIDLTQTVPVPGQSGTLVRSVQFTNQTQFGMRVTMGTTNGTVRVLLDRCRFTNTPAGLLLDERSAGCTTTFVAIATRMTGVATGLEVLLGNGGNGSYEIDTLNFDVTGTGVRFARPNGGNRPIALTSTQCAIRAAIALELAGAATGATTLDVRMADLRATTPTGRALAIAPLLGNVAGAIDELAADGNVDLLTGGGAALTITNARLQNGSLQLGTGGGQALRLVDCRLDGCNVAGVGTAAVQFEDCCVVGGSIQGALQAPLLCTGSFVQSNVGAFVNQTAPRPAAQLGSFAVLPPAIAIGGPLIYQADLPPGIAGLFALGLSVDPAYLALLPYPLHVYSDPAVTVTIPGIYRLQQTFQFAIPSNPVLIGADFTAHMAAFPDAGVSAPWINLPPGRRFALQ